MHEKSDSSSSSFRFSRSMFIYIGMICLLVRCGYTLNHRLKETFLTEKRGVFIPLFTNNTPEVGTEVVFTNALIRELESHGEKVASKKEDAGLEIRGVIHQVAYQTDVYSSPETKGDPPREPGLFSYARIPDQIGVRVVLSIEVWDTRKNELRWQNNFSQFRRVSAPLNRVSDRDAPSSLGLITQSIIESSYPDIARDVMRDLYDLMVDI